MRHTLLLLIGSYAVLALVVLLLGLGAGLALWVLLDWLCFI